MTVYTVSTTVELQTKLKSVQAGDTVLLKAGTYSGVTLYNINTSGVTVKSADVNNKAVITDMTLSNDSGLSFRDLTFSVAKDNAVYVLNSSNLVFDGLDVHGSLDGDPTNDFRAMMVRGGNNVTFSNNHFHELSNGLSLAASANVVITGNLFETIANDGVIAGGTSQITVSNNVFTDFYNKTWVVHPDAIQFTTSGATEVASDITITGNVIARGNGDPIQGIFLNDEVGNLPFRNVTIDHNVVVGESFNSIVVTHAANAAITDNMVLGTTDQRAWINTINDAAVYLADNLSTEYASSSSNVDQAGGDVIAAPFALEDLTAFSGWLRANATAGRIVDIASRAEAQLLPQLSVIGAIDGASPTGKSYEYAVTGIYGTAGSDTLRAAAVGASHLYGLGGDDSLFGASNGHAAILEGGAGNDYYRIYQSQDIVIEKPNEGNDVIFAHVDYTAPANIETIQGAVTGLTLHGNSEANTMIGLATGASTLYGEGGDDTMFGGSGADTLYGGDGNDRLSGNGGNDILYGGAGNDYLWGNDGADVLYGGDGSDNLIGGAGKDILTGGAGSDYFSFATADFAAGLAASKDIITDFSVAEKDIVNLTAIDANANLAGDQAFRFLGAGAFTRTAGELRYGADGDGITLYGDLNGDGVADLAIHLIGLTSITASSLWL